MNIHDLKPSITQMSYTTLIEHISAIRLARRTSKAPVKREVKEKKEAKTKKNKLINSMTPDTAAQLLKLLEGLVK